MRTPRNRVWILSVMVALGAAVWLTASVPPVAAGTVVSVADESQELALLAQGELLTTGANCNTQCILIGDCFEYCDLNPGCGCAICTGQLKCVPL